MYHPEEFLTLVFCISNVFRQEGWRLEHESPSDPRSQLTFKGVVFNEMKGAFVSPVLLLHTFGLVENSWGAAVK